MQYKVLKSDSPPNHENLDDLYKEGWELVTILFWKYACYTYFKRVINIDEGGVMTLEKTRQALEMAAKHKYGDGDYTAFFEKALTELNAYIARLESKEFKKELALALALPTAELRADEHWAPIKTQDVEDGIWDEEAQAAINKFKGL